MLTIGLICSDTECTDVTQNLYRKQDALRDLCAQQGFILDGGYLQGPFDRSVWPFEGLKLLLEDECAQVIVVESLKTVATHIRATLQLQKELTRRDKKLYSIEDKRMFDPRDQDFQDCLTKAFENRSLLPTSRKGHRKSSSHQTHRLSESSSIPARDSKFRIPKQVDNDGSTFTPSREVLSKIRQNTKLVDLISEETVLGFTDKGYFGRCPFNKEDEHFLIVDHTGSYFACETCRKRGDSFAFLQYLLGIDFFAAARILFDRLAENQRLD